MAAAMLSQRQNLDSISKATDEDDDRLNSFITASHKVQEKKKLVETWSHTRKLLMLAKIIPCKSEESCSCAKWDSGSTEENSNDASVTLSDTCSTCFHTLENHVSHLKDLSSEELKQYIYIAVDIDHLHFLIAKETDPDTKQVYAYLFKLLCNGINNKMMPVVGGPLGKPPFEKPSIQVAVKNFLHLKYSNSPMEEYDRMKELAKTFLNCLNHWKIQTPSKFSPDTEDVVYKLNYTRWMCFCYVPQICQSLQGKPAMLAFGRTMLRSVFYKMSMEVIDNFLKEKDQMAADKQDLLLHHFPGFISTLGNEVFFDDSPIWDPTYASKNRQNNSVAGRTSPTISENSTTEKNSAQQNGDDCTSDSELKRKHEDDLLENGHKKPKIDMKNEDKTEIKEDFDENMVFVKECKSPIPLMEVQKTEEDFDQNESDPVDSDSMFNREGDDPLSLRVKLENGEYEDLTPSTTSHMEENVVCDPIIDSVVGNLTKEASKIAASETHDSSTSAASDPRRCVNLSCRALIAMGDPHIMCTVHRVCEIDCLECNVIHMNPELSKKLEYNERKRKMRLKNRVRKNVYPTFGCKNKKQRSIKLKKIKTEPNVQTVDDTSVVEASNVSLVKYTSDIQTTNVSPEKYTSDIQTTNVSPVKSIVVPAQSSPKSKANRCITCKDVITKEDPHRFCAEHRQCDEDCDACLILANDLNLMRRVRRRHRNTLHKRKTYKWTVTETQPEPEKQINIVETSTIPSVTFEAEEENSINSTSQTSNPEIVTSTPWQLSQRYRQKRLEATDDSNDSIAPDCDTSQQKGMAISSIMSLINQQNEDNDIEKRIAEILKNHEKELESQRNLNCDAHLESNLSCPRSPSPISECSDSGSTSPETPQEKEISSMEGQLYLLNKRLFKILPDFFEREKAEESIISFSNAEEPSVLIVGTETLEKTWLADPPKEMESSQDPKVWDTKVELPTHQLTPNIASVFKGFPCCKFDSPKWDSFLSKSPKKNVSLSSSLSESTSISLNKLNSYLLAENHARTAIKAASVSDTYSRITEALLEKVKTGEKELKDVLEQLSDAIRASRIMGIKGMAAEAASVSNIRYGLRRHALSGLTSNGKTTQCLLRGRFGHSDFMGPMHSVLSKEAKNNTKLKLKKKMPRSKPDSQTSNDKKK